MVVGRMTMVFFYISNDNGLFYISISSIILNLLTLKSFISSVFYIGFHLIFHLSFILFHLLVFLISPLSPPSFPPSFTSQFLLLHYLYYHISFVFSDFSLSFHPYLFPFSSHFSSLCISLLFSLPSLPSPFSSLSLLFSLSLSFTYPNYLQGHRRLVFWIQEPLSQDVLCCTLLELFHRNFRQLQQKLIFPLFMLWQQ